MWGYCSPSVPSSSLSIGWGVLVVYPVVENVQIMGTRDTNGGQDPNIRSSAYKGYSIEVPARGVLGPYIWVFHNPSFWDIMLQDQICGSGSRDTKMEIEDSRWGPCMYYI